MSAETEIATSTINILAREAPIAAAILVVSIGNLWVLWNFIKMERQAGKEESEANRKQVSDLVESHRTAMAAIVVDSHSALAMVSRQLEKHGDSHLKLVNSIAIQTAKIESFVQKNGRARANDG